MSYINTGKATLTAGTEILYTGTLDISANTNELLSLAEMYQVETLTKISLFAFRESDIEEITKLFYLNTYLQNRLERYQYIESMRFLNLMFFFLNSRFGFIIIFSRIVNSM